MVATVKCCHLPIRSLDSLASFVAATLSHMTIIIDALTVTA
jgi:hypothetical protein